MKPGTSVRLIQPIIVGEVIDVEWDKDQDQKRIKITWNSEDGNRQERWFLEADLEVTDGSA